MFGVVNPENAVFVRVKGHRAAMLSQVVSERFQVGLCRLGGCKAQRQQTRGRIVDEDDEGTVGATPLEPIVGGSHQSVPIRPGKDDGVDAGAHGLPGGPLLGQTQHFPG